MSLSLWTWMGVVGVAVVVLVIVRWELVDFVLDRFGAVADWMRRGSRSEPSARGEM